MIRLLFLAVALLAALVVGCGQTPKEKRIQIDAIKTYRDIPGVTAEEIAAIEALKVGRDKFSYGVMVSTEMFPLPDGTYGGFAVKFCDLLTELFGIRFVLETHEWDDLIAQLDSQSVDFTGELTPTDERLKKYAMTLPIAERLLRIFTRADSDKIQTEADLEGLTIAFLEDTITAESIRKLYRVSFNSVEVADYPTVAKMLEEGKVDAFIEEAVADPAFDDYDFIRSQIIFSMVHSPVSMTTANRELKPIIDVVNKYIAHTTDIAEAVLFGLYQEGDFAYAKNKLEKLLTNEEKAYIKNLKDRKEKIRVAFEQDGYPTNFYNDKEKKHQGIADEVMAEISKLIDVEFEYVHSENFVWADLYDKVKSGEVPMMAQLLKSEPRQEYFIWSAVPYARSYYAIMSKTSLPNKASFQIARYSIGALRKSVYTDMYRDLFPGSTRLTEYDTITDCLDALERGEVDLLMASEYMLIAQAHYREKAGFKINLRLSTPMDSYFGFHKDETVLCSIISKAQQFVQTEMIGDHWVSRTFDYSQKQAEERMMFMRIFAGVVSLLLAASVFLLMRTVMLDKKLKEIASKDALTDIFNRRYFMELAAVQIERAFRTNSPCFIVIYDLDHFKMVNDKFGHLAGDKVLRETTQRVKMAIRPYDLFGRYGGEEFILLMSDVSEKDALNAVERLRQTVCKSPVDFEDIQIPVSASFGITAVSSSNDMELATKHADEALYRAKKSGRNRVAIHREDHLSLFGRMSGMEQIEEE
jgi:diguanylate cyclase (GGDEF)-like protein